MVFESDLTRPEAYRRFERPLPDWYADAKFGIFVHWGPYSVPAWAEPIGEHGTFDFATWFAHNPYAEWYANTARIEGSGAWQHQQETYDGAPYERFLDQWHAERFDPDALLTYFASIGAKYFVPTSKHHDGVTLWDAPGTGERNTVRRGPKRDLIGEFAEATRRAGLRFGVYYSGGLDWAWEELPPITTTDASETRPNDPDYAKYAFDHVVDLIERYRPEVLWGDIEWPESGKTDSPFSLIEMFDRFYRAAPDGVVNDRWGETHWDFRTSEYQAGLDLEAGAWENCRGIGYSFGYNRLETAEQTLDGRGAVRHLVDVVSRGGNLLLNVGLTASGEIPPLQKATLDALGVWVRRNGAAIFGSASLGAPSGDQVWNRWTRTGEHAHAVIDATGAIGITAPIPVDSGSAVTVDGDPVRARSEGDQLLLDLPDDLAGPVVVRFRVR